MERACFQVHRQQMSRISRSTYVSKRSLTHLVTGVKRLILHLQEDFETDSAIGSDTFVFPSHMAHGALQLTARIGRAPQPQ